MPYGDRRATVRDTWGDIFQGGVNRFSRYTRLKPSSLRRSISRNPWSWRRDQKAPKLRPAVRARRREGVRAMHGRRPDRSPHEFHRSPRWSGPQGMARVGFCAGWL